jgi:hypothetical protein
VKRIASRLNLTTMVVKLIKRKLLLLSVATLSIMVMATAGYELSQKTKVQVISEWEALKIAFPERNFTTLPSPYSPEDSANMTATLSLYRFWGCFLYRRDHRHGNQRRTKHLIRSYLHGFLKSCFSCCAHARKLRRIR